jgi:two-component system, sensor histidine kinase
MQTPTEADILHAAAERLTGCGSWRVGRDMRVVLSDAGRRILGLREASPAAPITDLIERIDPQDRPGAVAAARRAVDDGTMLDCSFRYRTSDGAAIWLRLSGEPIRDAAGRMEGMAGVIVADGDPAPMSSDRLAVHPTGARSIGEAFLLHAAQAVCLADPEGRVVSVSPAFAAMFDLAPGRLTGRTVEEALSAFPDRWCRTIQRAIEGDASHSDCDALDLPDGRSRWVRWTCSPWRNEAGDRAGAMLSLVDITDLVRAQSDSETRRRRMAFGLDISDMMICEVDLLRRDVAIEGDWKQFFPHAPTLNTLTGEDGAICEAGREALGSSWVAHLGGAPPYCAEYCVRLGDGREIWHALSMRILREAHGGASRAIAVIQDITDRKRVETRMREAEQRARTASAAKGEFLSNISHEIRTPLNGVLAVSDLLLRTPLNDGQVEMVNLVSASGQALLRVLDDIVDFTRIEADAIELDNRPFDLEATLRSASEAGRIRAEAKGIIFDCSISAALDGVFRGDPVRIGQVIGHLLNNAVKFTGQGRIRFSATAAEASAHTEVRLRVEDTGAGFDPEMAERIFEHFVQADSSTSRRFGGLGLGLSIVKRLVDLMDGSVTASSQPGKGAVFEVVLPLVRDRISAIGSLNVVAAEGVDAEVSLARMHVLVAEDNPMNRRVVELLLAQTEVRLDFAENGRIAVDRFCADRYDLVLMDLQMPVMGGLDAIRAIRAFEQGRQRSAVPILALSANASDVHVREAREAGADDHVAKPIVRNVLLEAIARHARRAPGADDDIDLDELDLAV